MTTKAAARAEAWGIRQTSSGHSRCRTIAGAVLVVPVVLFGVLGVVLWGAFGLLSAAGALLVVVLIVRTSTSALASALDPKPVDDPRLQNLVAGLSGDLGSDPPPTYVVTGPGRNALVFWHRGRPSIGLTSEAISSYARTELEAVIAHCLGRLDPSAGGLTRMELRLGGAFGACGSAPGPSDDARAAAITRYPPAVAAAIGKATPAPGRFGYLWFVPEGSSPSAQERIQAASDL